SAFPADGSTLNSIAAALTINVGSGDDAKLLVTKLGGGSFTSTLTSGAGTVSGGFVTPTGPVVAGMTWTLKLDTASFSYTAKGGDNLYSVSAGIAAAVNAAGTAFSASPIGDRLTAYDTHDATSNTGKLTSTALIGFNPTTTGIVYSGVESLTVLLGSGNDNVF